MNLQEMAHDVHRANAKWWIDINTGEKLQRNFGEMLMLVVTELSEALEGHRKNKMDDKLPHRKMLEVELADALIRLLDIAGGLEVVIVPYGPVKFNPALNVGEALLEITKTICFIDSDSAAGRLKLRLSTRLSYALSQIITLAEVLHLDLEGAYQEKMAYNAIRLDHTLEHRRSAEGKKY